jgi:hypothetical protein
MCVLIQGKKLGIFFPPATVRTDHPPGDRFQIEEHLHQGLTIAPEKLLLVDHSAVRSAKSATKDDREAVIQPNQASRACPDEVPHLAVITIDNPARLRAFLIGPCPRIQRRAVSAIPVASEADLIQYVAHPASGLMLEPGLPSPCSLCLSPRPDPSLPRTTPFSVA